jgi:hypothetical protein
MEILRIDSDTYERGREAGSTTPRTRFPANQQHVMHLRQPYFTSPTFLFNTTTQPLLHQQQYLLFSSLLQTLHPTTILIIRGKKTIPSVAKQSLLF